MPPRKPPKVRLPALVLNSSTLGDENADENDMGRPKEGAESSRKRQFRWNTKRDMALLLDVEERKPFREAGTKGVEIWTKIADSINSTFFGNIDYVGARNRFNLLLNDHKREDAINRYKYGCNTTFIIIAAPFNYIFNLTPLQVRDRRRSSRNSSKTRSAAVGGRRGSKGD